jgi:hypothetical protein
MYAFQTQHVPPMITGVVDSATAAAINSAVNAQSPPKFTVCGRVYNALSAGVGRLKIPPANEGML